MAKWQNDLMLDAALDYIKNNATQLCVCNAQPTTYAQATSTYKLALRTGLTSGSFTGPADWAGGRQLTVNQQAAITVDTGGGCYPCGSLFGQCTVICYDLYPSDINWWKYSYSTSMDHAAY